MKTKISKCYFCEREDGIRHDVGQRNTKRVCPNCYVWINIDISTEVPDIEDGNQVEVVGDEIKSLRFRLKSPLEMLSEEVE